MDFLNDIRFTLRSLAKAPGFSAVVILTLALGIGANASIFSVVNAVLLNPLPIADADDVVLVSETIRRDIVERRSASYPDFLDWRDQNEVFEEIVAFANGSFTITGDNGAERVEGELVIDGYFRLVGAEPALGRAFTPEENLAPETHPVAVISDRMWQGRFGADPEVLGRAIMIEERGFTVIGVAPPGFVGLDDDTDLWIPMMMAPIGLPLRFLENRSTRWLDVIARLNPGRTAEEAQAEMDAIAARLESEYPNDNENRGALVLPIRDEVQGGLRGPLLVLLATVGFVLLIACANVGNLMLTRIAARERETAVRAALGAGRARLFRQFLTESVVLSGIGGLIGILVSLWMVEALREFSPMGLPSYVDISVDGRVLQFTMLVAILTGVGIGAVATFHGSRPNLNEALKSGGRSGAGTAHQRLRSILVVSEVGLALLLLIGAGLMVESFNQMRSVETGFDADNLTTLRIGLPTIRYSDDQVWPLGRQLLERIEALPSDGASGSTATRSARVSSKPQACRCFVAEISTRGTMRTPPGP